MPANFELIGSILEEDSKKLAEAEKSYGDSWKQRGGVGAFMMLARKWDRLENQCKAEGYDIFSAIKNSGLTVKDSVIDDVRDLRRYLILVEQKMIEEYASGDGDLEARAIHSLQD